MIVELPGELREAAVALWHETGLTRPWNDPVTDLRAALEGATSTVLASVDEGRLDGTVMAGYDGHRGWLYYLAVSPAEQGRGLGKALVAAAEEWLRDRGAPKVQLMVRATNAAVVAFYAALGYLDTECVVLGRRLDEPT